MSLSAAGSAITAIANAIAGWFGWKNSAVGQRRAAESDANKAVEKQQSEARAIDGEVFTGDKDAVNTRLSNVLKIVVIVATLAGVTGCWTLRPPPVYVPGDRVCYPETNSVGVAGWFVPNATFSQLLKSAQRAQELEIKQDAQSTIKE